jgi:hypothetical protein
MRLREFLFGTALMSIALVATQAAPPADRGDYCLPDVAEAVPTIAARTSTPAPRPSLPSPLISEDKVLGSAYYDTLNILQSNNRCSDFFGGPTAAGIFNELISKIQKDSLAVGIGIRMSGLTTHIHDARTKKQYRIFEKVSLNSRGPFYRRKTGLWDPTVPRVGRFEPNTKEARVLMLLHELGHVIKGADGRWLLPDDGQDESVSRTNSQKIEDVCDEQIQSLGKSINMKDLGKYKAPPQQPASPTTSEGSQPQRM